MTQEDIWYFKHNGFYRLPDRLPTDLVEQLNQTTRQQLDAMHEPIVWEADAAHRPEGIRRLSKIIERDPVYLTATTQPGSLLI